MIKNGLYEGEHITFCVDRNSNVVIEDKDKEKLTFLAVYSDDDFTINIVKYQNEYTKKWNAKVESIYHNELERHIKHPAMFFEDIETLSDDELLKILKRNMYFYISDGKYEKAVKEITYYKYREYMKEWSYRQREEYYINNNIVSDFRGEYFFLNNDCPCRITYKGKEYNSVTEAYEDQKGTEFFYKDKLTILHNLLVIKFEDKDLRQRLKNTDCHFEWENEEDEYLGTVKGSGANKFGQMLEDLRTAFRLEDQSKEEVTEIKMNVLNKANISNALGNKYKTGNIFRKG